jgi:hypothetical protein
MQPNKKEIGGYLKLKFTLKENTNKIILNSSNINIKHCHLTNVKKRQSTLQNNKTECTSIKYNEKESRVTFKFVEQLKKDNNYVLHIK